MKNRFKKFFEVQEKVRKLGYDAQADTGKYKYDFVSISKLKEVLDPILREHKLFYTQPLVTINGKNALRTIIYDAEAGDDESNIVIESDIFLTPRSENNPQDVGSCITYFRRYSLLTIFGIIGDKDDDCLLSEYEIKERIKNCNTLTELVKLNKSINDAQKEQYKELFTERKKEIEQNKSKILEEVNINEG